MLQTIKKPFFVLAPMDDITDTVFRQIISGCAKPDLFITEFVNVDGLQSPGRNKLLSKLKFTHTEKPIFAQLWGKQPDNFYKTAQEIVSMGFSGIDINFGCPDKAVIKNGCCSAMINNRPLAIKIIKAVKEGVNGKILVSVKIRTGFEKVDFSWPKDILKQKIDMLTVHGRTTKDLSGPPANWDDISYVRKMRDEMQLKTLIVGNGDVLSKKQGTDLAKKHQLDGIMIGRGIFKNPYVFAQSNTWGESAPSDKIALYIKHLKLCSKTWDANERNPQIMKKFAKMYIAGFSKAGEIRNELMQKNTVKDMINVLENKNPTGS